MLILLYNVIVTTIVITIFRFDCNLYYPITSSVVIVLIVIIIVITAELLNLEPYQCLPINCLADKYRGITPDDWSTVKFHSVFAQAHRSHSTAPKPLNRKSFQVLAKGLLIGRHSYLKSSWNIMDGSLVCISVVDVLILVSATNSRHGFGILRVLRLLRALRPLR